MQCMTLQEFRDELERTRPTWEAMDLDGVLADGHFRVRPAARQLPLPNLVLERNAHGTAR